MKSNKEIIEQYLPDGGYSGFGKKEFRGSLYLEGCTLPDNLVLPTTIGGYLYLGGCTLNESQKKQSEEIKENQNFIDFGTGYIKADGIFSKVLSRKGNVFKVQNILSDKEYFLVTDGNGKFSHGDTIKLAKADLLFKLTDRDKAEFEGLDINTKFDFQKCLEMYRAITGACEAGIKQFINNNGIERKKFTILEMAEKTKGSYGNKDFCSFFGIEYEIYQKH